jgi:hypothetical protein
LEYITAEHALHRIDPASRRSIQFHRITILVHHFTAIHRLITSSVDRRARSAPANLLTDEPDQPSTINRSTNQP